MVDFFKPRSNNTNLAGKRFFIRPTSFRIGPNIALERSMLRLKRTPICAFGYVPSQITRGLQFTSTDSLHDPSRKALVRRLIKLCFIACFCKVANHILTVNNKEVLQCARNEVYGILFLIYLFTHLPY